MPEVLDKVVTALEQFEMIIRDTYFSSTIKYKSDHITIYVNSFLNLSQLERIKIKSKNRVFTLKIGQISISDPNTEIIPVLDPDSDSSL